VVTALSERSGVGVVQIAILESLALPGRRHKANARTLRQVEDRTGLAPIYAYPVLVDLALPWKVPVMLVDGQGNYGGFGYDPPADFEYTESRLTPAGQVVLSAEHGDLAPVPVGFINGNTYSGGTRTPFRPLPVIEAIRAVIRRPRISNRDVTDIIGPPDFLTGCTVTGDLAALAAGRPVDMQLHANLTISDDQQEVVIENIPPNSGMEEVTQRIISRIQRNKRTYADSDRCSRLQQAAGLDLLDIRDLSDRHHFYGRLMCKPIAGTPPEILRDQLSRVRGVVMTMRVALPRPLPIMIRQWVKSNQAEDLSASLAALETAISSQPRRPN